MKKRLLVLTLAGLLSSCAVVDGLNQGLSQINQELGKLSVVTKYSDKEIVALKKKYVQNGYWNIPALCDNNIKYTDYYYNYIRSPFPDKELAKLYSNDVKYGSTDDIVKLIINSGIHPKVKGYIRISEEDRYPSYYFYPTKKDYDSSLSTKLYKKYLPSYNEFLATEIGKTHVQYLKLKKGFNDLGIVTLDFSYDSDVQLLKQCHFVIRHK